MLESLIQGFLLGLGAAVPIGPINIFIINQALRNYKNSVAIGLGAMSADALYLGVMMLGFGSLVSDKFFLEVVGLFGVVFLFFMAFVLYRSRNKDISHNHENIRETSLLRYYFSGFAMTLVNPYTVAFWISVSGYSINKSLESSIAFFGLFLAILLWIILMPYMVSRSKHNISNKISYFINLISAFILFCFGVSLLWAII